MRIFDVLTSWKTWSRIDHKICDVGHQPRLSSESRALHSFKSPLACRTKIIPRRMHPTNCPDHLIFIRLVNADDSRTPSKRSRCARFRVTPETRLGTFVCITICKDKHLPTISTRNDGAYIQKGGRDDPKRVWRCPKRNIFVEGYDGTPCEIKFPSFRKILLWETLFFRFNENFGSYQ